MLERPRRAQWLAGLAGVVVSLLLSGAVARAAPATTTYLVNNTADLPGSADLTDGHCLASNGKCTLRAAIMEANHTAGSALILLPSGTYSLTIPASGPDDETTGDLNLNATMTIQGAGAASTIIDANKGVAQDRAISIGNSGVVSLSGVTIRDGATDNDGGGIYNTGVLSLSNSAVISNTGLSPGGIGGGITTMGTLTVTNSLIRGNYSNGTGGGVQVDSGSVAIRNSTIITNVASFGGGGGLYIGSATVAVYSSTITDNNGSLGGGIFGGGGSSVLLVASTVSSNTASPGEGGGLAQSGGTTNLVDSTVSGNRADFDGGGIWNSCLCTSAVNLYNTTVSNNQTDADFNGTGAGGGIFNDNNGVNAVQVGNSLIAGNWASVKFPIFYIPLANDCHGPVVSLDYNLIGTTSDCTFSASPDDQLNVPAGLGPLQNNGGPTQTHALLAGSLAIDAGAKNGCRDQNGTLLAADQRGAPRKANGAGTTRCDIGAFELQRLVYLPLARR